MFLRALGAALPLDHPSLKNSLANELLLPRPPHTQHSVATPLHAQANGEPSMKLNEMGKRTETDALI